ncbi:hypothetical protein G3N59_17085 [Paraburkholderia sp. Ac-20340]|uniref:hypothetical protein n=1 Tax=Paraburkholderia sp. Ac-20340 TaxID=2703888 RepID=UPI00197DCB09|nr:hypothetical protein [Paraburkholderia sp. Ac-20340]MBN3855097.1 hypothetical protein [Paraburkholderia sp. Ac-20340]
MNRSRSNKFTRGKFLPLPAPIVRATSLQNHLALEALRSRHGASLHATFLFRAVYLTYLLCDANDQHKKTDTFQEAEAALGQCSHRAQAGGSWQLPESDIDVFHCVLTLHDKQLQSVPAHLYEAACEQLLNYVVNGGEPVIQALAGDECVQ